MMLLAERIVSKVPNFEPPDALFGAAHNGWLNVCEEPASWGDVINSLRLLQHCPCEALASDDGCTPLSLACRLGDIDLVKAFCTESTINIADDSKMSPLMYACYHGHETIVRYLVEHSELDINAQDSSGLTALMRACCIAGYTLSGESELPGYVAGRIVEALMGRQDINVLVEDDDGFTACNHAEQNGLEDYLEALFQNVAPLRNCCR